LDNFLILAQYRQAEELLPNIKKILENNNIKLASIKKIIVNDTGISFSGLRTGITVANALAYALQIPVTNEKGEAVRAGDYYLVRPRYHKEPNIVVKNKINKINM
jgi:hypothetical protein